MGRTIEFGVIEPQHPGASTGTYTSLPWARVRQHAGIAMYPTRPGSDAPVAQSTSESTPAVPTSTRIAASS
jgi:hypothetical protein